MGSLEDSKLRSLSNNQILVSKTGTVETNLALSNNITSDVIWNTEVYSDRVLITLLTMLIGKTTDSQKTFGNGNMNGVVLSNGTMDKNGLFYGSNSDNKGVKIFGIENFWGNVWRRTAGCVFNQTLRIKLTYDTTDGSSVVGYNSTGDAYISTENNSTIGGYIKELGFVNGGIYVKKVNGSETTYYTDYSYETTSNGYACFGGSNLNNKRVGIFAVCLGYRYDFSTSNFGTALSCKPMAV